MSYEQTRMEVIIRWVHNKKIAQVVIEIQTALAAAAIVQVHFCARKQEKIYNLIIKSPQLSLKNI